MAKKDVYHTRDLYEASFLFASHIQLKRLEKEGTYYWFVFNNAKTCEDLISAYWSRESKVIAKDYADAIRSLKDRIFSLTRR